MNHVIEMTDKEKVAMYMKLPKREIVMKVYEFLYCPCCHESAFATISIHRTKAGAYKAMRNHRTSAYLEWYEDRMRFGKTPIFSEYPYDFGKDWMIREIELND